jgi:NhaA family Na+:H+ antiporter
VSTPDPRNVVERRVERIVAPLAAFVREQVTASLVLVAATAVALLWANSPWSQSYFELFETPVAVSVGGMQLSMSLRHWISEGLMGIFFYVLGLEIKRELLAGELRDWRRSTPVICAAIGGMLVPASLFLLIAAGSPQASGWGIPMATDTAFAVGVLALLAQRVPASLAAFVTALALLDDLGAIVVIAAFYSESIQANALTAALALLVLLLLANFVGLRHGAVYVAVGGLIWLALLQSGIHATVSGVLVAAVTPSRPKRSPQWFVERANTLLSAFRERPKKGHVLRDTERHDVTQAMADSARKATTPLQRWERVFERPVSLFVMPLFALANAGITIDSQMVARAIAEPLARGIALGLVVGKLVGITVGTGLALRFGAGRLPSGMRFAHVVGVGLIAGIGFTMSIFISELGFEGHADSAVAKTAILFASLVSGAAGYLWLRRVPQREESAARNSAG